MNQRQKDYYSNPDDDLRGAWNSATYTCNKSKLERPNLYYSVTNPNTGEQIWPRDTAVWRYSREAHKQHIQDDLLYWGKDGKSKFPRLKRFVTDAGNVVPRTIFFYNEVGHTQEATTEFLAMFPDGGFNSPKPTRLINRILQIATNEDSIVLDSFAGSGTTGQAVMQINAVDGGQRRFILIEMEPDISRNVTSERLRRVIQGQAIVALESSESVVEDEEGSPDVNSIGSVSERDEMPIYVTDINVMSSIVDVSGNDTLPFHEEELAATRTRSGPLPGLGGGFRYCTLGVPLFDKDGKICPEVLFSDLAHHIYFTETGEPLPQRANEQTPHIGTANGIAYYLLWNGAEGECVLDMNALRTLPPYDGTKIVYADGCCVPAERLKQARIIFKQVPYEVKVR